MPIWADHASRPDGTVLSHLPLEGHFCYNYSYSILFYASLVYRLLWKLRKTHNSFSCLIGRRSLYFNFLLGLSCFSSLWIADLLAGLVLISALYARAWENSCKEQMEVCQKYLCKDRAGWIQWCLRKPALDAKQLCHIELLWHRWHLGWSCKQMLDRCPLQRSREERSPFSKVLAN